MDTVLYTILYYKDIYIYITSRKGRTDGILDVSFLEIYFVLLNRRR